MSEITMREESEFDPMDELPRWTGFVGNCRAVSAFLDKKSLFSPWILLVIVNSLFRGFSQVIAMNNPFTGLLISAGLFWADGATGAAGILAALAAMATAVLIQQKKSLLTSGVTHYNAVLVGVNVASLVPIIFYRELDPTVWIYTILGAIISVFVTVAIINILTVFKIPPLALPFNIVTLALLVCLRPPYIGRPHFDYHISGNSSKQDEMMVDQEAGDLDWSLVFQGVLMSSGQVYAVSSIPASLLIWFGVLIASPLQLVFQVLGALVGTLTAVGLGHLPPTNIYTGVFGFNGLVSGSVIGLLFVPTFRSGVTAVFNAMFATFLQIAMDSLFSQGSIPVMSFPFCLSSLLFLAVTSTGLGLKRVDNVTSPEFHRHEFNISMVEISKQKSDSSSACNGVRLQDVRIP